jgi:thiol:disulfide interchange protein DsbA
MNIERRQFSAALVGTGLGAAGFGLTGPAAAQGGPVEGTHYVRLSQPVPADVAFRRVPVAFRDEPFGAHQRIYYALEAMGQLEAVHRKVFYAIHNERARLDKPADIAAFMKKNGLDDAKFLDVYNSFSVQTKCRQAKQLSEAYKIDGVPAIGVQGRYYTSVGLAGSPDRALAVTDFLIQQARKGA